MITENYISIEKISEKSAEHTERRKFSDGYARQWMAGMLMLTDVFSLSAAILIAVQLQRLSPLLLSNAYDQIFSLLVIILIIKFYRTGLYPGVGRHYVDELRDIVNAISSTFVIVFAVTFLLKTTFSYSRLILLVIWMLCLAFIPLGRYTVRRLLIWRKAWGVPVAIIGDPAKAQELVSYFRINAQYGIRPELLINTDEIVDEGRAVHPVHSLSHILEWTRRLQLDDALILIDDLNDIDALIDRYHFIFHRLILVKDQTGKYGLSSLKPLDFSSILGLRVKNNLLSKWSQFLKKVTDVVGSFLGLLFLSPCLGLIALLIKLDSPGDVLYRQTRLGQNGQPFSLLKFRTMRINADKILSSQLEKDPELKKEWDCYQKLKHDPRITRVGIFLRKYSLDELPQLFNIVKGEMSLVGPRPIMLDQHKLYGAYYKDYVQVVPGITGLWQVSGRNQTSFTRRAELDNEYIQRWSIWMDIFILFKTIKVVFWHSGAY